MNYFRRLSISVDSIFGKHLIGNVSIRSVYFWTLLTHYRETQSIPSAGVAEAIHIPNCISTYVDQHVFTLSSLPLSIKPCEWRTMTVITSQLACQMWRTRTRHCDQLYRLHRDERTLKVFSIVKIVKCSLLKLFFFVFRKFFGDGVSNVNCYGDNGDNNWDLCAWFGTWLRCIRRSTSAATQKDSIW